MKALWNYLRHDKRRVQGWLQRVDAEIIGAILTYQQRQEIAGSCVEIGLHHGKSFIPLCMALRDGELALGIDLFDDQDRNLDQSGKGNRARFERNLARFQIDPSRVRTIAGSSEAVSAGDILQRVGPVRFFSVDGGHWRSIVLNDLRLAEETLSDGGVIALDDYCRADWPDVTYGYSLWQQATQSGIVPFAVGSNKLFMCRKAHAQAYRAALDTPFLAHYRDRPYKTADSETDVYRIALVSQDEAHWKEALGLSLKLFRPDRFITLKRRFRRLFD